MKRIIIQILFITGSIVLTGLQSCKHEPLYNVDTTPPVTSTPDTTGGVDGKVLYANNCASCHGPLATSAKLGATLSQIQAGIGSNSVMKGFSSLTVVQLQAISDALKTTVMPTDGPTLYSINCSSCHGNLANSSVGGSSVSRIQQAIQQKSQMKFLSKLTLTQIQAIAGSLAGVQGGG